MFDAGNLGLHAFSKITRIYWFFTAMTNMFWIVPASTDSRRSKDNVIHEAVFYKISKTNLLVVDGVKTNSDVDKVVPSIIFRKYYAALIKYVLNGNWRRWIEK